jgi:type VII secretion-associated protein (TIGR03931 family)
VSAHRSVVEAGPGTIRRLCCSTPTAADAETVAAALEYIDEPVALVGARPVAVESLWHEVLEAVNCRGSDRMVVVHPSWWSPSRVQIVEAAARTLADDGVTRPRSWLLSRASPLGSAEVTLFVEIALHFVVVSGASVVAQRRCGTPEDVADAVVRAICEMTSGENIAVVVDAPGGVGGADVLATMIAARLRAIGGVTAVEVGDTRLPRLAAAAVSGEASRFAGRPAGVAEGGRRRRRLTLVVLLTMAVLGIGVCALGRHPEPATEPLPTTFLVEGRVRMEVPARWPAQRITEGPGSARVQITSPSDPQVALHVTQSPSGGPSLAEAAESLKHAIDAEPAGVFVDFNPSGKSAGRSAVTYREVRLGHDIRWAVLVDGAVRISIGCQSRTDDDDPVREACELAVRSARAIG